MSLFAAPWVRSLRRDRVFDGCHVVIATVWAESEPVSWTIERTEGPAGPFHERRFDELDRPTVWAHRVDAPALVLGSTTDDGLVDRATAAAVGVEVCRRRSGGGLVLVEPASSCWIDVLIPRTDPRWDDDVNRSFSWVGGLWASVLRSLGVDDVAVHDGPLVDREFGRALCFAGLGPGEVTVASAGGRSKVVGLSQRRTRSAARFQGLFVSEWSAERLLRLVRADRLPIGLDLNALDIGLASADSNPVEPALVEEEFLARLD